MYFAKILLMYFSSAILILIYIAGKLIGIEGTFINELKTECSVNIILRELSGESEKLKKRKLKHKKDFNRWVLLY